MRPCYGAAPTGASIFLSRPASPGAFSLCVPTVYPVSTGRRKAGIFGCQNQPPLPRRLAPNAFAGVWPKAKERGSLTTRDFIVTGVAADLGTMNDPSHIIIGERHGWGDASQSFGISTDDQRQHIYIIGKTGSGKTTLLRNLIVQHIAMGHGVGLIDPHGDLAEELLHHIPAHRADHLVYFNPGDLEFPIGHNLLANVAPDDRHLVASGIVGAFKSIWRDSWGPRLEYILYNAIAALLECENATLLRVKRMLTDEKCRHRKMDLKTRGAAVKSPRNAMLFVD